MLLQLNILVSLLAIILAIFLTFRVLKKGTGSKKMQFYSSIIRKGALTFLKREYEVIFIFGAVVFAVLSYILGIEIAVCFATGAVYSGVAGFSAMILATRANVRTAEAAKKSIRVAIETAFSSSISIGLAITGTGLLGVSLLYAVFGDPSVIYGFSLGASFIALFARVGGGIYTKAADVAADIVGKVESGITEDDPRNPAAIADNVGDNVGDVAGMGADLFESYVGSIIATMAIASIIADERFVILPMIIASVGIVSSIAAMFIMKRQKNYKALMLGCFVFSGLLVMVASLFIIKMHLPATFMLNLKLYTRFGVFLSIVSGIFAGLYVGKTTKKYTFIDEKYVIDLAKKSETGAATNILEGISLGMRSVVPVVMALVVSIFISFYFASIYGIALSAVSLLSSLAVILALDIFGPISDNAQGIAEMAHLEKKVKKRTRLLDSIGNTTAALGKGFAAMASAYTSLAFFFTYTIMANLAAVDLIKPVVVIGLFTGGMISFMFSSMTIRAVGDAANTMIMEARRQFRKLRLLIDKDAVPDYNRCIAISTRAALKKMMAPGLISVIVPVVLGMLLGAEAVAGMLAGCLLASFLLSVTLFNSGAAWDNAKKVIESRGEKGEAFVAAVVGDTVGDPFKDTAGPSLNILIKLISIVSLIVLPLILKYGSWISI
jgi:K(+)-stimulated pyrophosphate-energized sodium pump